VYTAVQLKEMPISNAYFLGGTSEVVVSGRKPFYCSYDIESGIVRKIPGIMGKQVKSYENVRILHLLCAICICNICSVIRCLYRHLETKLRF
jgi:hypothetical protein